MTPKPRHRKPCEKFSLEQLSLNLIMDESLKESPFSAKIPFLSKEARSGVVYNYTKYGNDTNLVLEQNDLCLFRN